MAYARLVKKGDRKERRLLVKTENEQCFGVQVGGTVGSDVLWWCVGRWQFKVMNIPVVLFF